jgi:ComF family protein
MHFLSSIMSPAKHLLYPKNCLGCGEDLPDETIHLLCMECFAELPATNYIEHPENPIEKKFWGRIPLVAAGSLYYFTKESLIQNLIFDLKYKDNQTAGFYLGQLLGLQLLKTNRFDDVDAIVPLPLNDRRERKRGYNQAMLICEGIQMHFPKPIINDAIARKIFTQTQTAKSRAERWDNMQGVFVLNNPTRFENKHVLLIDDVITTGATIEACGQVMLQAPAIRLSVLSVAYTSD